MESCHEAMESSCRDNCHDGCTHCACSCHQDDLMDVWLDDADWSSDERKANLSVHERTPTPFPTGMTLTNDEEDVPCTPDRPTTAFNASPHYHEAKREAKRLMEGMVVYMPKFDLSAAC